jgi:hypothetical protein
MVLVNRAWMMVTGSPGTGTVTLNAARTGYLTFAAAGVTNGQSVTYEIQENGVGWELGRGTYTSTGTTLARDAVLITSAGNQTKLNFTSAATVFITAAAEDLICQGKHTIWIPAGAMIPRTTNGAASGSAETTTNKVMIKTLNFDASTAEYAQFSVQMPKSWNEGTVSARFLWSHASTTTNFAVIWGIQGLALSNDDAMDAAFGTAQTVTDTGGTTNDLYRSDETSAVTIGGTPAEGDMVIFQAYRDAAAGGDTMAVDARLHGVELFYTINAQTDA